MQHEEEIAMRKDREKSVTDWKLKTGTGKGTDKWVSSSKKSKRH